MNAHIDDILKMNSKINTEKISITPSTTFNIYYENADDDIFYTFYQNKIGETKIFSENFPIAFRIGINTNKLYKNDEIIKKMYNKLMYHMQNIESLNKYYEKGNFNKFPNNIIIIETLVYDKQNNIIIKENKNETHVVSVLKYDDNDFRIYDPSRSSNSKDITKMMNEYHKNKNNIEFAIFKQIDYGDFYKIPQCDGKKPYETGYSSYNTYIPKYRDCIDIAVKISFILNELQKNKIDKILFISDSKIIGELSNCKILNDVIGYFKFTDNICLREIQSSCKFVRNGTLDFLIKNKDILKKYFFYSLKSINEHILNTK